VPHGQEALFDAHRGLCEKPAGTRARLVQQ
jgi:hypothetical protein